MESIGRSLDLQADRADNERMTNTMERERSRGARVVLSTSLARDARDIQAAQALRYRVFAEEMGAAMPKGATGLDRDEFDAHCEHLLLHDGAGRVIGTYRLLPAGVAARLGRFYSGSEFDLGQLVQLPGLVEVGRACIDPRFRTGAALSALLAGLARHIHRRGWEHVFGCASIPVGSDPGAVASLCGRLLRAHQAPAEWRVTPNQPFDVRVGPGRPPRPIPPLLRGYLRMGAVVCGPPAWDPHFRTADVVLVLPMARLDQRYAGRLLRAA